MEHNAGNRGTPQKKYFTVGNGSLSSARGRPPVAGTSQRSLSQHNLPNNSADSTKPQQTLHNPAHRTIRQAKHFVFDCNDSNPRRETVKPENENNTILDYSYNSSEAPDIIVISDDDSVDGNNEDTYTRPVDIPITNRNGTVENNTNDNLPDAADGNNAKHQSDKCLLQLIFEYVDVAVSKRIDRCFKENADEHTASAAPHSSSKADDENEEEADRSENDTKSDDDDKTPEKSKEKYKIIDFEVPPEYNPADSRWTLKHQKDAPELKELIPKSGVYINAAAFEHVKITARDASDLVLQLMPEIFCEAALRVCSLKGEKRVSYPNIPRPGLDANAVKTIYTFVHKHGAKRNWDMFRTEIHSVMRAKLNKLRRKGKKTEP